MTRDEESFPMAKKSKPPIFRRVNTAVGNILSPDAAKELSRPAKKIISALLDHIDDLEMAARVDIRTGLPNDVDCKEQLDDMIRRRPMPMDDDQRKGPLLPLHTVVVFDINGLGEINSKYKRAGGDSAIDHLAKVLRNNQKDGPLLRRTDYVARAGNHADEFTIILRDVAPSDAKPRMDALLKEIKKEPAVYRDSLGATFEIPVSACYGMSQMRYGDTRDALRERVYIDLQNSKDEYYGKKSHDRRHARKPAAEAASQLGDRDTLMGLLPGMERLQDDPNQKPDAGGHVQRHRRRQQKRGKDELAGGGAADLP